MAESLSCGLVLLAAGASRRMGRPKQLLAVNGLPLVRLVAESALRGPARPVVVVLGAHAAEIEPVLAGLPLHCVTHAGWSEGLGSSLRTGVDALLKFAPGLEAIIVALADQPGLRPSHLEKLVAAFEPGGRTIVASQAGPDRVPPVLFGTRWFPELRQLAGDGGARALLQAHPADTASVAFAEGADLDTPEDYQRHLRGASA